MHGGDSAWKRRGAGHGDNAGWDEQCRAVHLYGRRDRATTGAGPVSDPTSKSPDVAVPVPRAAVLVPHRPPILLNDTELRYEVKESKARLEDRLGAPVVSLSSPTGFFNRRMSDIAREEGYAALCGGRMAVARRTDSPYNLPRIAIKPSLGLGEFHQILRLSRLRLVRLRGEQMVRNGLKGLLGPQSYLRLRRLLLGARG